MVYVAQVLCPLRHCILAPVGEIPEELRDHPDVKAEIEKFVRAEMETALTDRPSKWMRGLRMNPWCHICKAAMETWTCEVTLLPADFDFAQVVALMKLGELEQLVHRLYLDQQKAQMN